MKVVRARLLRYSVPFRQPYTTAHGTALARDGFLVEIGTSDGVTGLGEASLLPGDDPDANGFADAVEACVRAALGREVDDLASPLWHASEGAAVEIAAWDALARAAGKPMAQYFGGGSLLDVPVNALVTALSPEVVYTQAAAAKAAGYTTVKLKVGVCDTSKQEVERVMAARSALGPDLALRLDANGAWSEEEAFNIVKTFAPYNPEYLEQPVAPGNVEALRQIRDSTRIPIAADEDASTVGAALAVINAGAADVLVLKPLQLGGITACRRVIEAATRIGIDVTITTSIDSGVGTAAALHLAAALGGGDAAGLATLSMLESPLTTSELCIERGRLLVPPGAGLGITLDEAALARYVSAEATFGV
ncbi:MAG TPA: o-succinylbenzoate synthase [Dehalococcoidia bacterium]